MGTACEIHIQTHRRRLCTYFPWKRCGERKTNLFFFVKEEKFHRVKFMRQWTNINLRMCLCNAAPWKNISYEKRSNSQSLPRKKKKRGFHLYFGTRYISWIQMRIECKSFLFFTLTCEKLFLGWDFIEQLGPCIVSENAMFLCQSSKFQPPQKSQMPNGTPIILTSLFFGGILLL